MNQALLLVGASVRALAFSAWRAGFEPRCFDLFADSDLGQKFPTRKLSGRYPHAFLDAVTDADAAPWMYTGGLENWPEVIRQLARCLHLWGNDADTLQKVRDPWNIRRILLQNQLPVLRLGREPPRGQECWLAKPLRGSGGSGIRTAQQGDTAIGQRKRFYYQEYVRGKPAAAIFVGDGQNAQLLGMSWQLVGEDWLGAAPFQYCGSIGPIDSGEGWRETVQRIAAALTAECGLRGLFGIDGVVAEGTFWTVEVNPRYTASVEVLEYATGLPAVLHHAAIFSEQVPQPRSHSLEVRAQKSMMVAKAILFARQPLTFPAAGCWTAVLDARVDAAAMPPFADLPATGQHIEKGRPILTVLARGKSPHECETLLREQVFELERVLYC